MEFEKIRTTLTPESNDKEMKQLNILVKEIKSMKKFPYYFGVGVVFTFALYTFSVYLDTLWVSSQSSPTGFSFLLTIIFISATSIFLVVGVSAVVSIYTSIRKEFDEIMKRQARAYTAIPTATA